MGEGNIHYPRMRFLALPILVGSSLALAVACTPADPAPGQPGPGTGGRRPGTGGASGTGGAVVAPGTGGTVAGTGGSGVVPGTGGTTPPAGTGGAGPSDVAPTETPAPADTGSEAPPSTPGASYPGYPALMSAFDGKTIEGWEGANGIWKVEEGIIKGGGQRGQLTTKTQYASFRLVMWKRRNGAGDHLGICLWGTKRVFDCLLMIPPSGAVYDYVSNKTERMVMWPPDAAQTWHHVEVLANRKTGVVKMAVDGKAKPDYMDKGLARRPASGPIGLQLHSGGVKIEAKEIFIEVDPTEDKLITLKP